MPQTPKRSPTVSRRRSATPAPWARTSRDHRMHRTQPGAAQHRDHRLRDHRQVDQHPVTLADPQPGQHPGEQCQPDRATFSSSGCAAPRSPGCRGSPRLTTPAGLDMPIHRVVRHVQLPIGEPPVERRIRRIHRPRRVPPTNRSHRPHATRNPRDRPHPPGTTSSYLPMSRPSFAPVQAGASRRTRDRTATLGRRTGSALVTGRAKTAELSLIAR